VILSDLKIKIQLVANDRVAIGPGKADLLEAIQQAGSISAAGRALGMSYKRAWDLANVMNKSFKSALINTSVGGGKGGGAQVTEFGLKVLAKYRAIEARTNLLVKDETKELMQMLIDN
jgi:molybdate transport system regulatory protein